MKKKKRKRDKERKKGLCECTTSPFLSVDTDPRLSLFDIFRPRHLAFTQLCTCLHNDNNMLSVQIGLWITFKRASREPSKKGRLHALYERALSFAAPPTEQTRLSDAFVIQFSTRTHTHPQHTDTHTHTP